VSAAIDQAERYSTGLAENNGFSFAGGPMGDHKVPFVFAVNGHSYLKQVETESGIWFRDARRAHIRSEDDPKLLASNIFDQVNSSAVENVSLMEFAI
jgi:hypothetical protein